MDIELYYYHLKIAGSAGPPSVNFEGEQAILRAIGQRAHLISTPALSTTLQFMTLFLFCSQNKGAL